MKLSKKAIKKINRQTKQKLAIVLGFSEYWVSRLVTKNKSNGPLVTPPALSVLREATNLEDKELLEETEPAIK
ncbi:MAG TPA: hypothetical protein VF008_09770 [Niastella sp.]